MNPHPEEGQPKIDHSSEDLTHQTSTPQDIEVTQPSSPKGEDEKINESHDSDETSKPFDKYENAELVAQSYGNSTKRKAVKANQALNALHPGCKKTAFVKFQNQFEMWNMIIDSSEEDKWKEILPQIAAIDKMFSEESENADYASVTKQSPQAGKKSIRQWGDYPSSDSDDNDISGDIEELLGWDDPSVSSPGITIPDDFETVWPKGYKIISDVCESLKLPLITTSKNLQMGGFRYKEIFSDSTETAKIKYAALDRESQASINALKALVIFLRIQPNQVLAQDSKFAVAASYVLHFLLKTGDVERDTRNNKCLKHPDGGRSIMETRLGRLFSVNPAIGSNLLVNLDKLYRAHARRLIDSNVIDGELRDLMIRFCFTSPEGMLNKFYVKERRREKRMVEKLNSKGKATLVAENKLVDGKRVPSLQLSSDFLTDSEKYELRAYEKRFDLAAIVKNRSEEITGNHEDFEDLTIFAENLVTDAYHVTKGLGSTIRRRKNQQRVNIKPVDGKVTPSAWQTALNATLEDADSLPDSVYEGIARFLQIHGR